MPQGDTPIEPLDACTFVLGLTKADNTPFGTKSKTFAKLREVQQLERWREAEAAAQHPSSKRPVSTHPIRGCSCMGLKFQTRPRVRLGSSIHAPAVCACSDVKLLEAEPCVEPQDGTQFVQSQCWFYPHSGDGGCCMNLDAGARCNQTT